MFSFFSIVLTMSSHVSLLATHPLLFSHNLLLLRFLTAFLKPNSSLYCKKYLILAKLALNQPIP